MAMVLPGQGLWTSSMRGVGNTMMMVIQPLYLRRAMSSYEEGPSLFLRGGNHPHSGAQVQSPRKIPAWQIPRGTLGCVSFVETAEELDVFIGERLAVAGVWRSARVSDGISAMRTVEKSQSRARFCGQKSHVELGPNGAYGGGGVTRPLASLNPVAVWQ
jgi:hypothetical protein